MITLAPQRNQSNGKFVLHFDASLYKTSNCFRKVYYSLVRGLKEEQKDFKMEYGTAFHKAMQVFYSGGTLDQMTGAALSHYMQPDIFVPESEWRNSAHLALAVMQYYNAFKVGDMIRPMADVNGKPMLERKFSIPFYSTPKTELVLSGTIDFVGWFLDYPVIVDHKTTSITQVDTYLAGYRMSPQLMIYRHAYEQLFPEAGPINCMINGIFLSRSNKNTFKRSELMDYPRPIMDSFLQHLRTRVARLVETFENAMGDPDKWNQNFTCCEEKYGMCSFLPACLQVSNEDAESVLASQFVSKTYNPLEFQV